MTARSDATVEMQANRVAAPTFQELMDPGLLPDPQCGMRVESATVQEGMIGVVTTGAEISLDAAKGEIAFGQRVGHPRRVAVLSVGRPIHNARIVKSTPGLVLVTCEAPKLTLRINGDSLFMLHAHEPVGAVVHSAIRPAWNGSYGSNHLLVDEWGGFGLYCSRLKMEDGYTPAGPVVATYPLVPDDVLWVGVCPPKPYDWGRSLADNIVVHGSGTNGYPSDDELRSWKAYGNIAMLCSEVMLWKDWNLDFIPREGPGEFARVRKTLHDVGMRLVVYASPYYFFKGTPLEKNAMNKYPDFKTTFFPNPGCKSGENMGLFMQAIGKLVREHRPDGLYFDGQYADSAAALYALARETRALLGEEGICEWHSTFELGLDGDCYVPQADAYVDFNFRGEGAKGRYKDFNYLRFFVSGYNVHNSVGVICNNYDVGVTPELARDVLKANARFHTFEGWMNNWQGMFPDTMKALGEHYSARLGPELRESVDRQIDARHRENMVRGHCEDQPRLKENT